MKRGFSGTKNLCKNGHFSYTEKLTRIFRAKSHEKPRCLSCFTVGDSDNQSSHVVVISSKAR